MRKPAAAVSLAFHGAALLLLFSLRFYAPEPAPAPEVHFIPLSAPPRIILKSAAKDAGGGQRQALPASRGHAPEPVHRKFTIPPMIVRNENAKLIIDQALVDTPDINIQSTVTGDPLGVLGAPSGGFGGPVGIGDRGSGGIGNGPGGPHEGSAARPVLKLTRQPQLIYKEDPEYSEEARRARYEGAVVIALDVDTDGRPIHIRVVRSLGLGLDEKAVAAVGHWKFRPAIAGDKVVVAPAQVTVTFRLL
jgi:TonB family protein